MKNLIDNLCQLTLQKKITWATIHHLTVHGNPYSEQFQHILPDKSFFTNFEDRTYIVLYGEVRDFMRSRTVKGYFLEELIDDKILKLEASENDIIKLHTLISVI